MSSPLWQSPETGRSISISSSFSFRVVRAGEAKLRVGVREVILLSLGLRTRSFVSLFFVLWLFFVSRRVGFKDLCTKIDVSRLVFVRRLLGSKFPELCFCVF